jgi:hypothetical protein
MKSIGVTNDCFNLKQSMSKDERDRINCLPFMALYRGKLDRKVNAMTCILYRFFSTALPLLTKYKINSKAPKPFYAQATLRRFDDHYDVLFRIDIRNLRATQKETREGAEEGEWRLLIERIFATNSADWHYTEVEADVTPDWVKQYPDGEFDENATPESLSKDMGNEAFMRLINAESSLAVKIKALDNLALKLSGEALSEGQDLKTKQIFACLESVEFNGKDGFIEVHLHVQADEACALCQQPMFELVRPIDLYPMFVSWASNDFKKSPEVSISISRIANALDPSHVKYSKCNEYGLLLNGDASTLGQYLGCPLWLPSECNNAVAYEEGYNKACTVEGSDDYRLQPGKAPSNMMVLVDWANGKFTYSTQAGNLAVLDLTQCRKFTASHALNYLKRTHVNAQEFCDNIYRLVMDLTLSVDVRYLRLNMEQGLQASGINRNLLTLWDICSNSAFAQVYDTIYKFTLLFQQSYTRLNRSLATTVFDLGTYLTMVYYGGENASKAEDEALMLTSPALNQNVAPHWTAPALPMVRQGSYLMPHQWRVLNRMRHTPNFALWPIGVGGGKTYCTIYDILSNYVSGRNAPYLILCPNSLVSQYVTDINYITEGRVNVIPIETHVIKRNGYQRLQKLFEVAPRNTIVVCSYDTCSYSAYQINYGSRAITRYPVVEFLRQFRFGYCMCDESHLLKNNSQRSRAVRTLISEISVVRMESGTLAYNTVDDMAMQVALLDPSIFGTTTEYKERFYQKDDNGRITNVMKPGAEGAIKYAIQENLVLASAKREEWAALLPDPITEYYAVDLSQNERTIYEGLIAEAVDEIQKSDQWKRAMDRLNDMKKQADANIDEIADLEDSLCAQIQPYLQRVERFLVAPEAETGIKGEIGESAKAKKCCELIKRHLDSNIPGKVIVFVENLMSASTIYEVAANHGLGGCGLLYKAEEKAEMLHRFNTDDSIKWMVGVETSINTGLNLQVASRIIRVEYPWTPGAIEQGDARILRPQTRTEEKRSNVYFDWIFVDGTTDSLKIARLMSKTVRIARFENDKDSRYTSLGVKADKDGLPVDTVPPISVTLQNIRSAYRFRIKDADGTNIAGELSEYAEVLKALHDLRAEDYKLYRAKHADEIDENGRLKTVAIDIANVPEDAKWLACAPYTTNMTFPVSDLLRLVRLDEYLGRQVNDESDDKVIRSDLKGRRVWTEYGECSIRQINTNHVSVIPVNCDYYVKMRLDQVFLFANSAVTSKVVMRALMRETQLNGVIVPKAIIPEEAKALRRSDSRFVDDTQKQKDQDRIKADLTIGLAVTLVNNKIGLRFYDFNSHIFASGILQDNGWRFPVAHHRVRINDARELKQFFKPLLLNGYKFQKPFDYSNVWQTISRVMRDSRYFANGRVTKKAVNALTKRFELTDPTQWVTRKTNAAGIMRIMPMFINGYVYATIPSEKVYGLAPEVMNLTTGWEDSKNAMERYFDNPQDLMQALKQLEASRIVIENKNQILNLINKLK